ncbi:MAG: FkbM family methyltransferase [Nitrosopumilus sp.]|nr:MAG: FkbM family methyltransferase [Nitrosopumilus sp.]
MRPKYYDQSTSGSDDTIKQVFDDLDYSPTWFFSDGTVETVIDIGAMIGSFTLWAHEKWPDAKIYSYEPDPKSFNFLKKNISTCSDSKKIKIFNSAIWNDEKEVVFQQFEKTPSCNSLLIFDPPYVTGISNKIKIETKSFSKIVQKFDKIDFLKIDCEGSEYDILYSLKKPEFKKIKYIALEYHEFDDNLKHTANELSNYLRDNGFLTQIIPNTSQSYGFGYIYAAKIENDSNLINKIFDGEKKRILKYIELPVELQKKLVKLQNEFNERTEWALTLDKQCKDNADTILNLNNSLSTKDAKLQETQEILSTKDAKLQETQEILSTKDAKLQETQEILSTKDAKLQETQEILSTKDAKLQETQEILSTKDAKLQETQEILSTKESQIEELQGNFYMNENELNALKNSLLFKTPFKIARYFDKIFPEKTKRGEFLRLSRMSLLIIQNEGIGALFQALDEKIKRQRFLKKNLSIKLKNLKFLNK